MRTSTSLLVSVSLVALVTAQGTTAVAQPAKPKPAPAAPAAAPAAPAAPATPAGPAPLSESLPADAKADYESGKLLFGDGDHNGALIKFQSAYDKSKDPRLLWNMAACEKNLRRYSKVLRHVRQYVDEGGDKVTEQDRAEARDLIKAIEPFTATVRLTVNEPGAEVFVDDESLGISPIEKPVLVDLGTRKIRVTKAGFREFVQQVPVGGQSEVNVDVKLAPEVHEGRLIVNAHPEDTIAIDGKVVGSGRYEASLKSGGHTLRVTSKGTKAYQAEVMLQDNETRSIDVPTLESDSKGTPAWLWVAGGAVVVAGASVGGYFLFKPKDEITPSVRGTIDPGVVQLRY